MKKIITYLLFTVLSICAFGQTRCDSGHLNIDLSFKRCVINNNILTIDFVVTNLDKDDIRISITHGSKAYDDEGNCYIKGFSFDLGNTGSSECSFPSDTPLKLRCYINDIDEYATNIVRLDINYIINNNYSQRGTMIVKNIPFSRE